jgi:DnaK suppressor protein
MGKMQSKMTKTEMKPFKQILLALRARLRGDVSTLADAALVSGGKGGSGSSSVPSHMADMGTDTFEQDNTLLLMHNEEETLNQIESALERIEKGNYGFCIECGARIPKARINALPYTPHCVKCASQIQGSGL